MKIRKHAFWSFCIVLFIALSNLMLSTSTNAESVKKKRTAVERENNFAISNKLEEARLHEEEQRTQQIEKLQLSNAKPRPVNEKNELYEMSPAPTMSETPQYSRNLDNTDDSISTGQASAVRMAPNTMSSSASSRSSDEPRGLGEARFRISPRAGVGIINSKQYNITGQYALGVGIGFNLGRFFGIEVGYTNSSYNVRVNAAQIGLFTTSPTLGVNALSYKTNAFDLVGKAYILGPDSLLRPYGLLGVAYSLGTLDYSNGGSTRYFTTTNNYSLNALQGVVGAGLDFQISKSFSVGAGYRFQGNLATAENENLNNLAFYNGITSPDPAAEGARGSIRDAATHMIFVSTNVVF